MKSKPLRLAFREEGAIWSCYIAGMENMEKAIPLGSIMMRVVAEQPEIKAHFMEVMKEALTYVLSETIGATVEDWDERTAPEKDRTKPS